MYLQYIIFMCGAFVLFILVSILLIPIAWLVGIADKLSHSSEENNSKRSLNILIFIFLGIPILILDLGADMYYFWMNNFRGNLNKIIIIQEKSTITNKTLREVSLVCL